MLTIFLTGFGVGLLAIAILIIGAYHKEILRLFKPVNEDPVPYDEFGYEDAATWDWPVEMMN